MSGPSAFSESMELNLDNGVERDYDFSIRYPFAGIPEGEDGPCHKLSNCLGWSLDGNYII
jgi:hypothetical protein